jgi:hypothetical protein
MSFDASDARVGMAPVTLKQEAATPACQVVVRRKLWKVFNAGLQP